MSKFICIATFTFVFDDFSVDDGGDSNAMNLQMASNQSNDIKWLASGRTLVAGSFGGDFIVSAGDNSPLTPANTNVAKETGLGLRRSLRRRSAVTSITSNASARNFVSCFIYGILIHIKPVI